ncbi:hypothetical protein [uncultured Gammaproteobacteria bacterium]|nr:hypothetical protein BROOK1789B_1657 [Bathymodiolus brooksi thiotrophic gill symbiont]CAC9537736.1 hypothetical protein [uncultured Gammaproteobacteria bacterium]CAC9558493.1 hypothetical protein [uncultured Gammaproteobacteria bacterium]CAC9968544.1 hypothetical protein [uncultured Gammaproteobacteria bacterium]
MGYKPFPTLCCCPCKCHKYYQPLSLPLATPSFPRIGMRTRISCVKKTKNPAQTFIFME